MNRIRSACALSLAVIVQAALAAPVGAQAVIAQDRYGPLDAPTAAPPLTIAGAAARAPHLRTRVLNWPGKTLSGPVAASASALAPMRAPARLAPIGRAEREPSHWPWRARAASSSHRASTFKAARAQSEPMQAPTTDVPGRAPLPTSIYDRPISNPSGAAARYAPATAAAPAAPVASLAAPRAPYAGGVRFYSVHRQFGLQPDPAPIAPQFFASTPDLSDPPGPLENRRTVATGGVSAIAARSAAQAQDTSTPAAQP